MLEQKTHLTLYVNDAPIKRVTFISREGIDTINSACWLFMDALWMFGLPKVGLLLGVPTIATSLLLLYRERRRPTIWMNSATLCWIGMNILWMFSDTFPDHEKPLLLGAKIALGLGISLVAFGTYKTGSIFGAIAHYKRYKSLGDQKIKELI